MSPRDGDARDDQFSALLAAYDQALAAGQTPDPASASSTPADLRQRLERAQNCLRRLAQDRTRAGPPESDGTARSLLTAWLAHETPPPLAQLGRFHILRELGRGGHGIVFLARDPVLHRQVALKVPRPEALIGPDTCRRFLREANAAAGLDHPNLVAVYEAGQVGPLWYIASAYCDGPTLAAWLKDQPVPVPPRTAAQLVASLADAVHHAHSRGILHRDLKPANILLAGVRGQGSGVREESPPAHSCLTPDPSPLTPIPKITDFGLAKLMEGEDWDGLTGVQTRTGAIIGTPHYMAPEQAASRPHDIGPHTDVYALGVILYEILAGRRPFEGGQDLEVLRQVVSDEPPRLRRVRRGVPRDLETICLKCLEKEPRRRYPSAAALADDLRRFLEGRPITSRPVSPAGRVWRWCRRNPLVAGLTAAALLLLAGAGITGYVAWQTDAWGRDALFGQQLARDQVAEAAVHAQAMQAKRLDADRRLYLSDMRLAQQAWDEVRVDRLRQLLDGQQPDRTAGVDLRGFEWHYGWRRCHAELLTLKGNTSHMSAVAFSPDGKRLAAGSGCDRSGEPLPGEINIWDVATGSVLVSLKGHRYPVTKVAFSPDGKRLVSGSLALNSRNQLLGGELKVWNVATGRLVHDLAGHGHSGVLSVAYSPDGKYLASGSTALAAKVWDAANGQELFRLEGHANQINGLSFSPDSGRLATASADQTVKVWDLNTRRAIFTGRGHMLEVNSVAWIPDGKRLASASNDKTVRVWDAASGVEMQNLTGHTDRVYSVGWSHDGRRLASASLNKTVKVWDAGTGEEAFTLQGHTDGLTCLAFHPHDNRL
ncbi:MAG TPA: serine/threonine-protein kinase, partial [Gemmataceae bacterium]|nr:serine/threonine-protein kinase [Gemmataceae bacterium]